MSGLTPLWLMALAVILAVLVGIGGGASQLAVYEVLRDFQTLIAAFIAMGVGYYAARPVYLQLKEARRQSSAMLHDLFNKKLEFLAEQDELTRQCFLVSRHIAITFRRAATNADPDAALKVWVEQFRELAESVHSLRDSLRTARAGTASADIRAARLGLYKAMERLDLSARKALLALMQARTACGDDAIGLDIVKEVLKVPPTTEIEGIVRAARIYGDEIGRETMKVRRLANAELERIVSN